PYAQPAIAPDRLTLDNERTGTALASAEPAGQSDERHFAPPPHFNSPKFSFLFRSRILTRLTAIAAPAAHDTLAESCKLTAQKNGDSQTNRGQPPQRTQIHRPQVRRDQGQSFPEWSEARSLPLVPRP